MTASLHPYARLVNPQLASVLGALALDVRYVAGSGCWLEDDTGRRILDATSGYGSVSMGHNADRLWEALDAVRTRREPSIVQPSILDAAGALAERLCALAPDGLNHVTFANSGAEAVEVAIKLARSATGRPVVVSTHGGFHGKTLGALSATGRARYQTPFGAPAPHFVHVAYGDLAAVDDVLHRLAGQVAGVLVEPIQGEGGVVVPDTGYLPGLRRLCDEHDVLLLLDEVQTGLGRTGRMFAGASAEMCPDVLALAKALGGGLVPAAAVLCRDRAWSDEFALRHTSTFAANAVSARVGLAVLDMLEEDDQRLVTNVAGHGERLLMGLRDVAGRHPGIVTDVRGSGFLLGVELTAEAAAFREQCLLGALAEQEVLAPLLCADLLHRGAVRVAPTVFGTRVLRVEPPLVAEAEECDTVITAFARSLEVLEACDTAELVGGLLGRPSGPPRERPARRTVVAGPADGEPRWAFVLHPVDLRGLRDFDSSLDVLDEDETALLFDRLEKARIDDDVSSLVLGRCRVASRCGGTAYGELIGLPLTSEQLLDLPSDEAYRRVGAAVALAHRRGAQVVGLGAYTSIVTANGRALGVTPVPVTTGNGFTVAAAVDALRRASARSGAPLADRATSVVGATGAIGRGAAHLLAEEVATLHLLANPRSGTRGTARTREVARSVCATALAAGGPVAPTGPETVAAAARRLARCGHDVDGIAEHLARHGRLVADASLAGLPAAGAVLTCTSTPRAFVDDVHLGHGAVVCDVAQPPNVVAGVATRRPDLTVLDGGVVNLPGRRPLGVRFGLPTGQVFACMAETMLLSLEGRTDLVSAGAQLDPAAIRELGRLAHRHGFEVAIP